MNTTACHCLPQGKQCCGMALSTASGEAVAHCKNRRGFSLLEVLLATGILLGCVIVLSELASIGRRHVRDAEDLITAQRICQTKINEVLAGLQEPVPVEYAEVEDEPGWLYSVATERGIQHGMIAVRVSVTQDVAEAGGQAFVPFPGRSQEFAIVRWVRDPEAPRGLKGG